MNYEEDGLGITTGALRAMTDEELAAFLVGRTRPCYARGKLGYRVDWKSPEEQRRAEADCMRRDRVRAKEEAGEEFDNLPPEERAEIAKRAGLRSLEVWEGSRPE